MSRYRGRHRKPSVSHTGRNLAVVATSGAFALPAGVLTAEPAAAGPPGGWGPIISCESGGNARIQNSSSTASGLFQFLDSTWQGLGFSGRAKDASVAQQYAAAEKLYAQSGTSPWNASKSCWAGKSGAAPRITGGSDGDSGTAPEATSKPRSKTQKRATTAGGPVGVRGVDGSGAYVCGPSHYQYEACDPGDDGQVMQYPLYEGKHRAAAPVVKMASARKSWPNAPADIHLRDQRGHGQMLCDPAHRGYDACDPPQYGRTVPYPLFDQH